MSSPTAAPSTQLQLKKPGGAFEIVPATTRFIGTDEVSIRVKAIALNNLDVKQRASGMMIPSWPAVLGLEASGVVERVGEAVKNFSPGDEVCAIAGQGSGQGAFQDLLIVPATDVAKKPASMSFEEASLFPVAYLTAACAIVTGLGIPMFSMGVQHARPPTSVLVLGASSVVGSMAVQLLRLFAPEMTILVAASAQHHARLIELGANQCFDRDAAERYPLAIRKAAGGAGVDAILDSVAATVTQPNAFSVLSPVGLRLYSQVATGLPVSVPPEIRHTMIISRRLQGIENGLCAYKILETLLATNKLKVPVRVEVVGTGLSAIAAGLDRLGEGASGEKFVVSLS